MTMMAEVINSISKMNRAFNPFHMESLSKFSKSELRGILNQLAESGYIKQTIYRNNGFSVEIIDKNFGKKSC